MSLLIAMIASETERGNDFSPRRAATCSASSSICLRSFSSTSLSAVDTVATAVGRSSSKDSTQEASSARHGGRSEPAIVASTFGRTSDGS